MSLPLLSIIIPVYKPGEIIFQVLESVFETSKLIPIEIVMVFNGPAGKVRQNEIEEKLARSGIKHAIFNNDIADACKARNKGMQESSGEYLKFLDADDILLPSAIARQYWAMKETRIDVLTGDHFVQTGTTRKLKPRKYRTPLQGMVSGEIGITSSAIFRKNSINRSEWPEGQRINEEKEFYWLLFNRGCHFSHDNEPVFIKTETPHSLSAEAATTNKLHKVIAQYRLKIYQTTFKKTSQGEQQAIITACTESFYRLMNSPTMTSTLLSTQLLISGAVTWKNLTAPHRVAIVVLSPLFAPMALGLMKKFSKSCAGK